MKKQIISLAMLTGGFILGASALVALADTGSWNAAPATPPNSNVAAPINVGAGTQVLGSFGGQEKTDSLAIDGNLALFGKFIIPYGASTTNGAVLTTDGTGNVSWALPSSAQSIFLACGGASSVPNTNNCSSVFVNNAGIGIMAEGTSTPGTFDSTTARMDAAGACAIKGSTLYGYTYNTIPPPGCGQNYTKAYYNGSQFVSINVQQCGNPHVFISGVYCTLSVPPNLQQ